MFNSLTPQRRLCLRSCPFVVWLVCQQDYTKSVEQISTKLDQRTSLSPEQITLTSGVNPDKGSQKEEKKYVVFRRLVSMSGYYLMLIQIKI